MFAATCQPKIRYTFNGARRDVAGSGRNACGAGRATFRKLRRPPAPQISVKSPGFDPHDWECR
jgi:hypothetical protein